jgi:glycosyltransferase involved in cell wall biosynthesis
MKIALLTPSFLPVVGGAELGAAELARRLTARGHNVAVVTPRLDPRWRERETQDGIEVHRYAVPALGGRHRTANIVAGSMCHLGRLWRRLGPDVINQHYLLPTGIASQWWARRLGVPTVTTLIGMDIYDPHYRPAAPWRALMRRALRHTQAVICISSFVRDIVRRDYRLAPGVPLTVVPHGVDVKMFHPRAVPDVRRADCVILTVQRLYARKGVATFLEAAALVLRERPDARFVVVGDGPERTTLERRAAGLGLGDRVVFKGRLPVAELTELYGTADVFAFHTLHEGLGIVLLEALASGCPVVTTAAGGTLDIVRDGDTGLVVEPADAPAFARAVLRVLREPDLAAALRARGRRRVEAEFDWDVVTSRYLDVFESARARPLG